METKIYALTDSHQESSNLSKLLSTIYLREKNSKEPFLILDCGDLFKGIYDKDLSVNAYLKIKQLLPHSEIFITLGNNDFGFNKKDFEYLKETISKFKKAGIHFVCANLKDSKSDTFSNLVPRYGIINIDEKKILITGFCVNNSCAKKFGYTLTPPEPCFEDLIKSINENYDKIIVLNHHWYTYSKSLKKFADSKNINIDLIIGGHEHSPIKADFGDNIFYPYSFARSLYEMTLDKKLSNIKEYFIEDLKFIPEFEIPIREYENKIQLKKPIAKRVLNLTKWYSEPCPLGTFISDNMKKTGQTEIAFHSTGFTMYPLRIQDSDVITKYDLNRVICADSTIEKIKISTDELKKVFENATLFRMYKTQGNSRFVQCSGNITITGKGNLQNKTYKITQIAINGENLLDGNQNPINPLRKFTCTIDPYIGSGEQGFEVLKNIPKTKILKNNQEVKINQVLYEGLKEAEKNFDGNSEYPSFEFIDL